ncbi:type I pullulanase [Lacticaseibacillus yichunensis]|uniref:Type I pullulanase n=1 Tax=Lacticaseibacillus yichunensis TaxID=2486015 RepID=A0ABW4CQB0_9LACO|nr:type I pullulanase [Lacticaseibacillus yichunensis]
MTELTPEQIDAQYAYYGPLGPTYRKTFTRFRLWAPTARAVTLKRYADATPDSVLEETISMMRGDQGVWTVDIVGDMRGTVYTFSVVHADETRDDLFDPYAKAAIVNGERSVVLAPEDTVPANWGERLPAFSSPVDAVIVEADIRDFSIAENSGIQHRGQYLGLTEANTHTPRGAVSGLAYLKTSGATHVQLMPIYDFATVDETKPDVPQQNWGYDPLNHSVPEGSYATDATTPATRIKELKTMIQTLHDNGLRVIMDVVYNHVFDAATHALGKVEPGYFFRHDADGSLSDGTGTGNDFASERVMARKYIVDSVRDWAKDYQLDGFRFDLMGILDVATMQAVRAALDEIDPSIIVLGEGWAMATPLPAAQKAIQANASQLPHIAFFNDDLRDLAKGDVFIASNPGFVSGAGNGATLAPQMTGRVAVPALKGQYLGPDQVIQYVEAHDNLTLYDKLTAVAPDEPDATRVRRALLAISIVLLAQGVPFLQLGQAFMRTKNGDDNSYRAGDAVNAIDWDRQLQYPATVAYVHALIELRRAHPALRQPDANALLENVAPLVAAASLVAYQTTSGNETMIIAVNASDQPQQLTVPAGEYSVLVDDTTVINAPQPQSTTTLTVAPLSALVAVAEARHA